MKYYIVAIIVFTYINIAAAQFSAGADVSCTYDNNIDNNYLNLTDRVISTSIGLEYFWTHKTYEIGISYNGSINYYSKNIDRSFFSNEFLFLYTQAYGKENLTQLDFEAGFTTRAGRELFSFFDNSAFHISSILKHDFSDVSGGHLGYVLKLIRFNNISDFNYTEHSIIGQFNTSFITKTSITISSDYYLKIYSSQSYYLTDTVSTGGTGHGQNVKINATTQTSNPTVSQLSAMVKIAQSIFDGTGLSFASKYWHNFRKETKYLYGAIPDDEVFDDHYGYEGLLLSASFTQILPLNSKVNINVGKQVRKYSTLPAYDLTGVIISNNRNDKRTFYGIEFFMDFEESGLSINVSYDHVLNSSNDKFYDYKNNVVAVGLSLIFN